MNWPLCLSPQIQIIKANAVPLCAVAMGTGMAVASSLLFALAGNQSASGGGDGQGRVGGDWAFPEKNPSLRGADLYLRVYICQKKARLSAVSEAPPLMHGSALQLVCSGPRRAEHCSNSDSISTPLSLSLLHHFRKEDGRRLSWTGIKRKGKEKRKTFDRS
ncbi:hypothetical protein Q5P01_017318 [Channa striata]|uniref:Uncharacterized protein n=1 Tax=Channa striata TaxID=64152 RepID=A0AA88MAK7_CHASR|nr:hypothetical protein Q5P01_017318 [Channa striata]